MRIIIFALTLTLGACTTLKDMDVGLNSLIGQPIQAAFARLGYPNQETAIAGRKVFLWSRNFSAPGPVSTTSTTTGMVGNTPYTSRTTNLGWEDAQYSCVIRVFTDKNNAVQSWDYDGNIGGCEGYAKRFKM